MTAGRILFAVSDSVCLIRMEGRVTYSTGPSFSAFIDKLFADGPITDVVVDLSQAEYLDSTTLGLLGKLSNSVHRELNRKVTVFSPGEDVLTVLSSMGFDTVFTILKGGESAPQHLQNIPLEKQAEPDRARVILDAHRLLMEMNDANAARFRDVVEALEKEISSKTQSPRIDAVRRS